jgi:diphthamide synthase (EF-2-diphthine--ammonia ligase)
VIRDGFTHVAFGDLFLEDVRRYRETNLAGPGYAAVSAVADPDAAAGQEMIDGGLRARLACVDTRVLDASFCGREFDASLLADLPAASTVRRERRVPHLRLRRPDVRVAGCRSTPAWL